MLKHLIQGIGPIGCIAFSIGVGRLAYVTVNAIQLKKMSSIGEAELFSLITVVTVFTSAVFVVQGLDNMSKYQPFHFQLNCACSCILLTSILVVLRIKNPHHDFFWRRTAKRSPESGVVGGSLAAATILIVGSSLLPFPIDYDSHQQFFVRFYSFLVGDARTSIGIGVLTCWLVVLSATAVFASLDRMSRGNLHQE